MMPSRSLLLLSYVFVLGLPQRIDAVIYSGSKGPGANRNYKHPERDFTIQTVSLTQKGYIQFLKYTSKVPTLTDYTFCIWVRSNNFTYNHPLLSYSKNDEERLIRVWLSERGEELRLEILNHPVFNIKTNLEEDVWYHICQSWTSQQAAWEVFFNGKLKSRGFFPKLKDVPIKGGGDIVVGQEYTDFDKGLDDGIEGDISGFNFVLSSTFANPIKLGEYPLRRRYDRRKPQGQSTRPLNIYQPLDVNQHSDLNQREFLRSTDIGIQGYLPETRFSRSVYRDMISLFQAELLASRLPSQNRFHTHIPVYSSATPGRKISNEILFDGPKPLGLMLVELSFDCGLKKGAPLSGNGVLISWTKSPVRVFGGAILRNAEPFCRTVSHFGGQ